AAAAPRATRSTRAERRAARRRGAPGSVGRELRPPRAELLEGVPKFVLGLLLVERGVDVGDYERLDRGGEPLQLAEAPGQPSRERELEAVHERERVLAHHDDELRLDDVQLAHEERARVLLALARELDAVRPVDRKRI